MIFALFLLSFTNAKIERKGTNWNVFIPSECQTVVSSEFSTGGDGCFIQYVEIDCMTKAQKYKKFFVKRFTVSALFALARFRLPETIRLKQSESNFKQKDTFVVNYPKGCEIKSTEFSTGGGNNIAEYLELDLNCNGKHEKQFAMRTAASGFFGLSRWFIPDAIEFEEWDKDFSEFKNSGLETISEKMRNRETWTVQLPTGCTPVNSELSSSSYLQYLEIDCRFEDQPYTKYFAKRTSWAGVLGSTVARIRAIPLKMQFEYGDFDGAYLKVSNEKQASKSGEKWHVVLPKECINIKGSSYSSGGTSIIQYVEVDCTTETQETVKFIAARFSRAVLAAKTATHALNAATEGQVDVRGMDRVMNLGAMIIPTSIVFVKGQIKKSQLNANAPATTVSFYT